ncbi:MAG: YdbL family protein [Desulfobulbus sp.]|nr:YdbL family protein [Desulfobulbus sp.]
MKRLIFVFMTLWLVSQTAFALDLQTAKSQGVVGETPTGYLAAVNKAGGNEVSQLVQSINQQRKQEYQKIAQRNSTTLQAVEKLAGKQALEKTPQGQFILKDGTWTKK